MWGRRRARRREQEYEAAVAEARSDLTEVLRIADETHAGVVDVFGKLRDTYVTIEELLDQGDGLPAKSARARLACHREAWDEMEEGMASFAEARRAWDGSRAADAELFELTEAATYFADFVSNCADTMEEMAGLMSSFLDLYRNMLELRDKLAPMRERAHAAIAAAANELAWAGPTAQGKFALEVRLHAAGDRLRELDAGRVELEPGRKVTDWYRDVESEIAEIREAVLRLGY
ncbi:hypothetical protein LKL35_30210 [Streptomyces sp. ET3-23]|uniref:hypothetical protein n=1 Tax=Streptomyces sp. ET3-23 TaxID=2885643 RepID=UPI001D11EEAD|nr:hypothetical protein [Streptomyces sp. ET3-23]MCC2279671.1 hypothetical protein [Streptomyces sp. ET3-23]